MQKYVFKPYDNMFPELFNREKERIVTHLNRNLMIEHVGSTAVPGLGGKGIIDIAIAVEKQDFDRTSKELQALGYEYKPAYSTQERWFFIIDLPDAEEGVRRYHVHLTFPDSEDWNGLIVFRDHLRSHPEDMQEYADLKSKAALEADQDGEKYRKLKSPFFKKLLD
jgi:GrpB-like predicted nucleotidyltransferase (UPF0157 family)